MSLREAATKSRVEALTALRDDLANQLDVCESARDYAALSQRFMDVLEQIADIEAKQPATKGTALDEFTRRRQQAASPASPPKRNQRG